jgi:hypothetical protein
MKRKLMNATLAIAGLFLGFGCSTDDTLTDYEVQQMINNSLEGLGCSTDDTLTDYEVQQMINNSLKGQWTIVNINVSKEDWIWNDKKSQWEAVKSLPELTSNIYEEGAQLAYLFLGTQGSGEVQKLLPYVETWSDVNGNIFTETISCDYQLGNPSTVAFFIKESDLYKDPDAPQNYAFRIVLLY